jgi:restriction system protein
MKIYRVRLGKGGSEAAAALAEGWVGTGWLGAIDLTGRFPDDWRPFNAEYRAAVLEQDSTDSVVAAGIACAMTWQIGRGLVEGDRVITRDASGTFHVGEITGHYLFAAGATLPHRRPVTWFPKTFQREEVSEDFWRSLRAAGTVADMSAHAEELAALLGDSGHGVVVSDADVENPLSFVLEKHLEDFLVSNWDKTDLAAKYRLFEQDGEVAQQFPTDTGPIDILAETLDGSALVVIELKRGRVSDRVVGQTLRYMGYVKDLDPSREVRGLIIGTEEDLGFQRALSVVPNIEFLRYEVYFKLVKNA